MKSFYVSVIDGPRYSLLAGPFDSAEAAESRVELVRSIAADIDPKSHFYAFGTCGVEGYSEPGFLNRHGFI